MALATAQTRDTAATSSDSDILLLRVLLCTVYRLKHAAVHVIDATTLQLLQIPLIRTPYVLSYVLLCTATFVDPADSDTLCIIICTAVHCTMAPARGSAFHQGNQQLVVERTSRCVANSSTYNNSVIKSEDVEVHVIKAIALQRLLILSHYYYMYCYVLHSGSSTQQCMSSRQ